MMEVSHSMEEPDGNSVVKRLSVPIGLEELMTSLTKEVLKKKPIDIYNFASDHFTQLLTLRESGSYPEPTAKIITYINNVDFKHVNKSEKQSKDKQLARQVSLNVQPFIQDFKIVGKKSELKSDKRNKKEEAVKQRNEKLKLTKKKTLSKLDQEKNLNLQNDNKNKSKESNGEVNKKSKKILDKTLPSKGKSTKIKKRVKSVDNFTSFSNISMNHNIIDPEDIQINSLDKDNISLSSENINTKNYNPSALRKELIKIHDESKFTSFTTTYNPYKLRQEIRSVSLDETATADELENKVLKDDVCATDNVTVDINEHNKVEKVEEKVCSINESDKAKDVMLDKNLNSREVSVIENEEIDKLEANGSISTADAVNEHNHNENKIEENIKVLSEEDNLNGPSKTSKEEKMYNASKIFASAGLAAVKIQSMWRGFKTRKNFPVINNKNSNLENKDETSSKFSAPNNEMILNAATKIQAGVRGYLSRKQNKKVVHTINDEKQNGELKNKDELKEEMQNKFNHADQKDNLIENQSLNINCSNEDKIINSEIQDTTENNKNITEIEIVKEETTNSLNQPTEPLSLQKITESNSQTVIENEEKTSLNNEINTTNIESEVNKETSKTIENLPKFEENTTSENITAEIVSAELNKNSEITENIEKNVIIEENVNNKNLELKSIASELDENLPSTTAELNLKSENNEKEEVEKNLESTATENEGNIKNNVCKENSIENIDKEIVIDTENVSGNNNTGSTELVATINDENFVNENENNKQGGEKRSINFQEIIEEENNKLIDSLNNSKNIAINNEPNIDEINKEIEKATNEHLDLAMQPVGIEDENNKEFQKDSKNEEESIESNPSLGSTLQHSGELHDTPAYFNEKNKLSSDSISENVEKEDRKSLLNLEHSGELHDLVIVEKDNAENETRQSEESNINSTEHKLQEDNRKDHIKNINIIEDSIVLNFEDNYDEIITKDTSELYDIEELIESEDKTSVTSEDNNLIKDINVVSQLNEVNIDRKECDKEPDSEEKEKRSLDDKAESNVSLQLNEENIKSDEPKEELLEVKKSKVPEDILIQSENATKLSDTSVQIIEDVTLQPLDKETMETEEIVDVGTSVLEVSTDNNKLKADENEEELTEKKINIVNNENIKNPNIENNISEFSVQLDEKEEVESGTKKFDITKLRAELNEANADSKEDADLVTSSENEKSSETNKIKEEENAELIEDKSEIKKFDITKLRSELQEVENINTKETDIGTPTNEKSSVEESKNILAENVEIKKEISKIEVTKLGAGLDVGKKVIQNISIDESTVDSDNSKKDIIEIEENAIIKTNEVEKFDITKLRAELEEVENINTEGTDLALSTNEKHDDVESKNSKNESSEIEEQTDVKGEIRKTEVTKLGAELAITDEITKDTIIEDSTKDTGSSENNITEKEEKASIEENLEAVKNLDITKLSAELNQAENVNTKKEDLDTPTNENNNVEEIKNGKEEIAENEKSTEVEKEIKKIDVLKLGAGLDAVEEIITDIKIDSSVEDTGSSQVNIAEIEEKSKIEGNVEILSETKQFDITKLRSELEEAQNTSTNLDPLPNGKDIVEEITHNDRHEEATEVEKEIEKTEVTKLDAELPVIEEITKDIIVDESTENTGSSETTNIKKEEIGRIEDTVEAENAAKTFNITKLRAELDEAENINTESIILNASMNGKDIIGAIKEDKKENVETEESTEVEKEIEKTEVTKLNAGLPVTEEITKDTIVDESTENTGSSETTNIKEEEIGRIEEIVEAENAAKTFDMLKLRAELDEAENINTESIKLDGSINGKDIIADIKEDKKEKGETEESTEVEKEIEKTEVIKLNSELPVTEEISKDTIINESIENIGSSKKTITKEEKVAEIIESTNQNESTEVEKEIEKTEVIKLNSELPVTEEITKDTIITENTGSSETTNMKEEETGTIEEIVENENAAKKFDTTKLRAELDEAENIGTKNLDTSINEKDIVGEIKDDKKENAEIEESKEVEKEIGKSEVTKLEAGLPVTEKITKDTITDESTKDTGSFDKNIIKETETAAKSFDMEKLRSELYDNKENAETEESGEVEKEIEKTEVTKLGTELEITKDTIIDKSIEDTENSEKNITKEKERGKIEENAANKFDITKLRAELDEAEVNTKSENIAGNIEDNIKESAETEESREVERDIAKTEVSKLDVGLTVTEEITKDTIIHKPTEDIASLENKMPEKEENKTNQFDINKLRTELDQADNINAKITNLDTLTNGKDIVKDIKNGKEENAEIEEGTEVEKGIVKTEAIKVDTALAVTKEIIEDTNINILDKEENDIVEEVKNGKEENGQIEKSIEVEKEIESSETIKLDAGLPRTEETIKGLSIEDIGSSKKEENADLPCETKKFDITKLRAELYDGESINTEGTDLDKPTDKRDENIEIKEDIEVENGAKKFDISKLRAELDNVQLLNEDDKNVITPEDGKESPKEIKNLNLELNINDIKEENSTVGELNEEDNNKSDGKVEENTTTNNFDLSKLHAELYDIEESKEDPNLIENIDKPEEVATVTAEIEKTNKFDLSKLRAELSEVDDVMKPTDEKELDNNKSNTNVTNTENEAHSVKEINSTSQLHLIDNEDNNDAIKSNTTNDVDHQLTSVNNDIEDVNKVIKNENTSQLEPQPTTHSINESEFEFIPTESSDNLIISPNDSNQSFSNKEVEPKINKEVMTNTNQESNFNQINNETNSTNRQDDMIDERAQSGISASPDSDVTVIFNTNSLNKLDDNLVNISGNSTPADKTELETEESVVNDIGENLENNNKSSFDISKLRMEIENSSKATSQEIATQEQTEDSMSESKSDLKSTDDTLHSAATLIQSIYRGYHVRNKLKDKIKKTDESKEEATYSTDAFNLVQPKKEQDLKNEDFGISDALGNMLNQQLAIAAPNAVDVDKSGNQPEYIHIPLKGSIDESNSDQNRSMSQLQHSGEFHDVFPISSAVSKRDKLDEMNNIEEDVKKSPENNKEENEEKLLKLHQAADGSVPQALEVVLNQQLAITTPYAKFEEKDKVDYIHIPLKDPVDVTDESANKNNEAITDLKQHNRSDADDEAGSKFSPFKKINESVNNEKEESANNNVLVNYSFEPDGTIHDESMPMVVQNTQNSGSTLPVEVQPNQAPGAEILTSSTSVDETEASLIIENPKEIAQTSEKDASSKDEPTKNGAHLRTSMETSNRENTTLTEQNMENVAATKIQASFRGYQVRKQLKPKILKIGKSIVQLILLQHNGGVDSITLRRSLRRKSSGKLRGSENTLKKQMDKSSDLEEKSATKIQAGIRGFLVRRRQTKAKNVSQKSS